MTKYSLRAIVCTCAFVTMTLTSGCHTPASVRVVRADDSSPVAGAEVYADNTFIGQTDGSGLLVVRDGLLVGTKLVARKQIFERAGFRPHHDPANGLEHDGVSWTERVYLTTMEVPDNGILAPFVVSDPAAQQNLILRSDNTLIGLHFMVSVNWDASDVELVDVGERFRQAGEYIYNATDGQIYFEQVDIIDDSTFWNDAEYHWHADTAVWPTTSNAGGLLVPNLFGSVVELSRDPGHPLLVSGGDSDSRTIAHEFGHFGFGLLDEYLPGGAFCTSSLSGSFTNDPLFGSNMSKSSCVMFAPSRAKKFCSNHRDNPHHTGGLQSSNCWETIVNTFSDHTNQTPQWTLKSPDTRGAIVGQLQPELPQQWQARINIDNRASPGSEPLCQPFNLTARWSDGSVGVNLPVTLAVASRLIAQGPTGTNGQVRIVGAHPGDRIWIGHFGRWRDVISTPALGPNTCWIN